MSEKQINSTLTQSDLDLIKDRGYANEDIVPKLEKNRNMDTKNFFTLWMGSIHNIPNYAAVGGYLLLGLSPLMVMLAVALSGLIVALFMSYNGRPGAKYGIPFAMHLRSTYGNIGAKLPGFLRGVIAAIAWFGVQTYTGSAALLILISQIWPEFAQIGGGAEFLGITIPGFIAFILFWIANMAIGFGGGDVLNKFTGILTPIIYIVFGAMAVWAIIVAGGMGNILNYSLEVNTNTPALFAFVVIISSILSVWAAPGVSVSDFTQNATSNEAQTKGQVWGLFLGYIIFAFTSVVILVGGSIHFGAQEVDVLHIINKWDSLPAIAISTIVFLMTTISTNATGNIIPAAYQLTALFPKQLNYRKGVIIAGILSIVIMPWRFLGEGGAIITFLNLIGAMLGPVGGVMIAHYYIVKRQKINLNQLYMDLSKKTDNKKNPYYGINVHAYIATLLPLALTILGQFVEAFSVFAEASWVSGFILAVVIYLLLVKFFPRKDITGVNLNNHQ